MSLPSLRLVAPVSTSVPPVQSPSGLISAVAYRLRSSSASAKQETAKKFTIDEINNALSAFVEDSDYGMILRAKGIVEGVDGEWIHFDYVPAEPNVRHGAPGVIGRLCVIGSGINNDKIKEIFGL